jgi:hypothetical protein
MLQVAYNPQIPSYLAYPASVRFSTWEQIDGQKQPLPMLSEWIASSLAPKTLTGVEHIEITPDEFTGAYYSYQMKRLLVVMKYQGCNVFISASRQMGPSEVGMQGIVLGSDNDWNYIYTGKTGLAKSGLGWVDTYIYDSASITVYVERPSPRPKIHCAVFQWLRAGMSGLNLVRSAHIYSGLLRFAENFKTIVESPMIMDIESHREVFSRIENMPLDKLRAKTQQHLEQIGMQCKSDNTICRRWFEDEFRTGDYMNRLSKAHMQAVLCRQYLKYLMGKDPHFDLTGLRQPTNSRG